ncbi:hypothetical protein RJ640_020403 [Escallonia rubra]|uniref:Chromo domain-containing protein n=1 Tax=Escallonia rubra TaxID=112253 RepID=A0AA88QTZ0_9ASTE|nr:hypothetical protein RJ640_020403 [Escallonia rubra]
MAYKVDSPNWWSRQLHPIFHVSMLKPFYEDTADPSRGQIRRPGLKPKAAGKRVAEAILNDRVITVSRKRHQEYLVKWQGYMDEENTWERAADLSAYTDKIEAYHMQKLTRTSTALVGENVTGCPLHPPSTAPPRPSSTAPPHPSNTRPCALTSSSSLAPMHPSSIAPARPTVVPVHVLVDSNFVVPAFPMLEQSFPDVSVGPTGKEGEDRALVRGLTEIRGCKALGRSINLGHRYIPSRPKSFRGVGIAKDSDEVLKQARNIETYPIVTRNHKMVSTMASVPIRKQLSANTRTYLQTGGWRALRSGPSVAVVMGWISEEIFKEGSMQGREVEDKNEQKSRK